MTVCVTGMAVWRGQRWRMSSRNNSRRSTATWWWAMTAVTEHTHTHTHTHTNEQRASYSQSPITGNMW